MRNLRIIFSYLFLIYIGELALKSNSAGITLSFPEVYTNSAKYKAVSLDDVKPDALCTFIDDITGYNMECSTFNTLGCLCTNGQLVNLLTNNLYVVKVKHNDEFLTEIGLRTASTGTIFFEFGVTYISYNIEYNENEVVPFACVSSLTFLPQDPNENKVYNQEQDCKSKRFDGLLANTTYILSVVNNDNIFHQRPITTMYFNVEITALGMEGFSYLVDSNFGPTICDLTDSLTNDTLMCSGNPCNCLSDTVTNLRHDTNFSIQFFYNTEVLTEFQMTTASNGTIFVYPFYNGLYYQIIFDDTKAIPSFCYPCTVDLINGEATIEECWEAIKERQFSDVWCEHFSYRNLEQNHYYRTILFDSLGSLIGVYESARVVKSEIIHTAYQLTSISYELDSELSFNLSAPCHILNSYGDKRECEVNNVRTTNCPCLSGKLINLPINQYIYVELMQGDQVIAKDDTMYTADEGQIYINSLGVYHFEYLITFYYDWFPPYTCLACLTEFNLDARDCPENTTVTVYGRDICLTYIWNNLKNGTKYRLLMFDGDHVIMHNRYTFTSILPIDGEFIDQENSIYYKLIYSSEDHIPTVCRAFFQEDPTYEAECQNKPCDCKAGVVIVPTNSAYKNLFITDEYLTVLFKRNDLNQNQNSAQLTLGGIIGIAIFVLLVVMIVMATVLIIIVRKRKISYSAY